MSGPHPGAVLGALADARRLRALAAVVQGATTAAEVAAVSGLRPAEARAALERLVAVGLVVEGEGGPDHLAAALGAAARSAARLHEVVTPEDLGASAEQAVVLRGFLDERGRLTHVPAQRSKRLVVLDFVAARFEPGRTYPERDVTFALQKLHGDYAMLRRLLVDEGFLERRDGFYWRAGGTVDT